MWRPSSVFHPDGLIKNRNQPSDFQPPLLPSPFIYKFLFFSTFLFSSPLCLGSTPLCSLIHHFLIHRKKEGGKKKKYVSLLAFSNVASYPRHTEIAKEKALRCNLRRFFLLFLKGSFILIFFAPGFSMHFSHCLSSLRP